jgi:hypothetical protein
MGVPPPIFRADLKHLSQEERKRYFEGVWRKCEYCNPFQLDEDCPTCCGKGFYLRMQYSAQVVDATDRLGENATPDWD